ncbi:EF-hand calcium-binding domain-containing protein 10-like [Pomacea canaliculata]|uniref:EF-hand calcium-binding domain-containing protein 10-like n=1 Tax=Pomacea canaliculata TaxID=400727 RepID=UPI000D726A86|nr:EF-hand calcium-binding domain-containing protein 10-like [Pomacea canaliculata]
MAAESVTVSPSQVEDARTYLQKHQIVDLFNNITSQLIYSRPDEPKKFITDILERIQRSRSSHLDLPCIFDESNIVSVFGMLDPTGSGFINLKQYHEALITLGVKDINQEPKGHDSNKISMDVFVEEAKKGLARASATFQNEESL